MPDAAAVARHRPARPERAARLAAHRLGHRHPHRAGGVRAPPDRIRRTAPRCSWKRSTSTRWSASCSPRKASPRSRNWRWSTRRKSPASRASTRTPRASCRRAPANISTSIEAELDAKRKELGVEDAVKDVPGVTTAMLVKLGENGIKTVEDLAGCATDDLIGWTERKDGESKREPGILDGFDLSREDAEAMIMQARVKAGWVTEADLAPPPAPEAEAAPSRGGATRGVREHDTRRCWRWRTTTSSTAGPRHGAPGTERTVRAHPHGEAGRRPDPLRRRRRTATSCPTSSASCPAAASGSPPTAQRARTTRSSATCSRAASSATCAPAADLAGRDRAAACSSVRSTRWPSPARPAQVVGGFAKVEAALGRDDRRGPDPCRRRRRGRRSASWTRPWRAKSPKNRGKSRSLPAFTGAQLDLALGRSNVVHAALLAGPASETFSGARQALGALSDRTIARFG